MEELTTLLVATALAQHGAISREQMRHIGLSNKAIRYRCGKGLLKQLNESTFILESSPHTWQRDLTVAWLSAGPGALIGHRSALRLWELDRLGRPRVEVLTPFGQQPALPVGRVIQSTKILPEHRAAHLGFHLTSVERTLIDCGRHLSGERLTHAVDTALHKKLTTLEDLRRSFLHLARRGRPGIAAMRVYLEDRIDMDGLTEVNSFERMLLKLIETAGVSEPIPQYRMEINARTYFLDFAWPEHRVYAECDGFETHGSSHAITSDLDRQNEIGSQGWKVLRFSWTMVRHRPDSVVRQLKLFLPSAA